MLETVQHIFDGLEATVSANPWMAGVISVYGLGVLTYLLRGVPRVLWALIKRHTTTSLIITSSNLVFHNFMVWLHKEGYSNSLRNIKLTNGRWGSNETVTKGAGYGGHLVWYRKRPLLLHLNREETRSEYERETLQLIKLGRSHALFNQLMQQFAQVNDTFNKVAVYTFHDRDWSVSQRQYKRTFDSVFLEADKRNQLTTVLDDFQVSEDWYIEHGIPYRLGILLYGPPGTGKTSLIKSIAAYTGKNLCILSAGKLSKLLKAAENLPEKSLMVIEDIDSNITTHRRKRSSPDKEIDGDGDPLMKYKDEDDGSRSEYEFMMQLMDGGLSEVLNSIDGISDTHGRILVLTTNNPEKLDDALLRPGRIDLSLELGYVTPEVFVSFMSAFFPSFEVPATFKVKEKVTISTLQQCVLMKERPEDICKKYLKE